MTNKQNKKKKIKKGRLNDRRAKGYRLSGSQPQPRRPGAAQGSPDFPRVCSEVTLKLAFHATLVSAVTGMDNKKH